MRVLVIALLPLLLLAQPLSLPVRYDPFALQPPVKKSKKERHAPPLQQEQAIPLHLVAIYGKRAYINGRFVQKGDCIAGFRVVKIENDRVMLVRRGVRRILYFAKPIVEMAERKR